MKEYSCKMSLQNKNSIKTIIKKEQQSLLFFIFLSFGFHVGLFVLLISSSSLWSVFQKDKKVFTSSAIRVDMVGLPELPSKKTKKNKALILPKKTKKQSKNPDKKSKALTKKEVTKSQDKQNSSSQTESKNNLSSDLKKKINKGNKLTEGADNGKKDLSVQEISEINKYATLIDLQIRSQWNLPKYLTDRDLTAKIEIKINARGDITSKQLLKSSGNDLFDSRVLKAMENAAPYPPPPVSVQAVIRDGIVFELSSRSDN